MPAARDEKMARDKFSEESSAPPPAPKRARTGFDVKIREECSVIDPLRRLKRRMEAERDALGVLLEKAALLTSRAADGRSNVKTKTREGFATGKVAVLALPAPRHINQQRTQTGARKQSTEPKRQQQEVQRVRVASRTTKGSSMASRIDKAKEAMKKRRLEEIARAREKFRQELIEVEKAAMPDETIYPEELEELAITAYQYDVTRTRKQSPLGSG
ncbi:hypothetical protein QOZ80_5BG0422230 [Eleusine coracana subsp. coracana]|nr:hypothetical protein QOZ80_5BG0422230 [Eleusine coracana subsp. coracana]